MGEREAIVIALESLEVGDVRGAVAVLLSALEDGPASALVGSASAHNRAEHCEYRCACGARFEWPGLLDRHEIGCLRAAA